MTADLPLDNDTPFGGRAASWHEWLVWRAADWHVLPSAWRRRLRKRFARPVHGPFDISHRGMKFRLYPAENYCDRVLFGRRDLPERAEHEALIPLLTPGMVFVDIGANVGSYSIFVGTRAPGATLIAFEPHPRTFAKLIFNLKANSLPAEHAINAGVGAERSTMTLWSDGGSNIGHTSLLPEGTANARIGTDVAIVPLLQQLEDLGIGKLDLLKIDIEGFEDRALAPFLRNARPDLLPHHILIEIAHNHLWQTDLEALLDECGYRERFATAENRLLSLGD